MLINKLEELFEKLQKITGFLDVGYHQISEEKLNPIYKSGIGELSLEKWKEIHKQNPVYIHANPILQQILREKKTIVISNIKEDTRSTKDVFLFGIDSIMMIPVIKKQEVIGVVPMVSIGKFHDFNKEEVEQCENLVNEYLEFL